MLSMTHVATESLILEGVALFCHSLNYDCVESSNNLCLIQDLLPHSWDSL